MPLEEMDDELEHGTRCAICLVRLQDVDLIGDISCGHALHKDCLKDWLKRKNRCPLCQQTRIARLHYPQLLQQLAQSEERLPVSSSSSEEAGILLRTQAFEGAVGCNFAD